MGQMGNAIDIPPVGTNTFAKVSHLADMPSLSVVIPHLNEPNDLERCLRSLEAQRQDQIPFEIIVVDNNSTELPVDTCSKFDAVRLELERTPGPGPARNRGASVARAELVAFLDADCVACPGWVRTIVEYMAANPKVDVVGGDICVLPQSERLTAIEAYESVFSYRARLYVEKHGFTATGNMAVRRRVFQSVGPFGGIREMEDTEWGQRATRMGYKLAYVGDAKVLTPSCRSFRELARRWDRHVAHDFRHVSGHPLGIVFWLAKAGAIAASPLISGLSVMRAPNLSHWRERGLALACLVRARLYRARLMASLVLSDRSAEMVGKWNQE
jgi:glycosyltransferase involved in cell wall biosynthesis